MSRIFCFVVMLLAALPTSSQYMGREICAPQRIGEDIERYRERRIFGNCDVRERMQRDAAKRWNQERQAKLKADTDKLFRLSTELKQQVDKSNENILSLDVIKKAEEIEKLAKSVREKMKAEGY